MNKYEIMIELCADVIGPEQCPINDDSEVVELFQDIVNVIVYDSKEEFNTINNTVRGSAFVECIYNSITLHIINNESYGIIAHEAYHIALRMLELNGIYNSENINDNEECIAKLVEFIVEELIKLIK